MNKWSAYYAFLSLFLLIGITFILIALTDHYILTVNFYENSGDPLAGDPALDMEVYSRVIHWVYLYTALYLLLKVFIIAGLLQAGLYLAGQTVIFHKLLTCVALAEFIFFVPAVLKIIVFRYYYPEGRLEEWQRFYILSVLPLARNVGADWIYPLQTLNLFEAGYWFLLALGIKKISGLTYEQSLRTVIISYLPALTIWILTITFCAVLLFPQAS